MFVCLLLDPRSQDQASDFTFSDNVALYKLQYQHRFAAFNP